MMSGTTENSGVVNQSNDSKTDAGKLPPHLLNKTVMRNGRKEKKRA